MKNSENEINNENEKYPESWTRITNDNEIKNRLPLKPFSTNDFGNGMRIFPREFALKKRYIQLNPPHMVNFITFDLDYDTWPLVWEDENLPPPLYFVQRKSNGHAHLIYGLATPVCCSKNATLKPQNFLKDIIRAYQIRLHADPSYVGLMSKNPFSDFWRVVSFANVFYTLNFLANCVVDELAEWNSAKKAKKKTFSDSDYAELGRNCDIFVSVKNWSYRAIKDFWGKNLSAWSEAVEYQCRVENAEKYSENQLGRQEIREIAKSIARWTWRHFTPEKFSEIQSFRGKLRWEKYSEKDTGIKMLKQGFTPAEISQELGVSERNCYRWKKEIITPERKIISNESKEWEKLGISRRWFFELKKRGEIKNETLINTEKNEGNNLTIPD